jgi:NADPH-dependent curcumin reductase CurA
VARGRARKRSGRRFLGSARPSALASSLDMMITNPTMLIAVTGANGAIGRRVVLLALKQGHHVRGIDSSSSSARTAFRTADDEEDDRLMVRTQATRR